MGLAQTILADVTSWGEDAMKIAGSAASIAIPGLGTAEAALGAIDNVAKVIANYQAMVNTPEMKDASAETKLLAFKARVDADLVNGPAGEADLEQLEAGGPQP